MKSVEFYDLSQAIQSFLESNREISQNFWEDTTGYSVSQSAISRYIKGERKPIKEHHRNIYRKMVKFLDGDYPITEEEFLLEPKERARPYLQRVYDYKTVRENFSHYARIADHFSLEDWKVVIRYDLADQLYKDKKYNDALEHLRDAELYNDLQDDMRADVQFLIGKIKMRNSCWKLALRSFEKAYDLNPNNHHKFHVAQSKQMLLNFSEGDRLLNEIIEDKDQKLIPSCFIQLAYSHMKRCQHEQAMNILESVLEGDITVDQRKEALYLQGQCSYHQKDYFTAIEYYNKSLDFIDFESHEQSIKAIIGLLRLYSITSDHEAYKDIMAAYQSIESHVNLIDFVHMEMIQSVYLLRHSKNYRWPLEMIKKRIVSERIDQEHFTLIFNDLLQEANKHLSGKLKLMMLERLFEMEKDVVKELIE